MIVADDSYSGGKYVQDQGEDLYRRSVYTWWKRTCPPPGLNAFDAPDREFCTVQRTRTNTPLQALVLLNDPTYVEAARVLAVSVMTSVDDPEARLALAFRRITGRQPDHREKEILGQVLDEEMTRLSGDPAAAQNLIEVGEAPVPRALDPVALATWTVLCSMLLNLDETVTQH